jgi:orotidine-5'-phosphate decarboxylase
MREAYLARLGRRIAASGTVLCVGLDPDPAALPDGFAPDVRGISRFARLMVEACAPVAAAFKPNLAYFEAFGSPGLAALEALRATIPSDVPVLIDAKRGDIGTTAARQAAAIVEGLGADAVTVNPYLGLDAVAPFVERGAFCYVLSRTSNPSAGEVQDLALSSGEKVHERVAAIAAGWDGGHGTIGLVVGATAPAELAALRHLVPGLPFLVPGVGTQGGSLEAALQDGPATSGPASTQPAGALLVNVSRGIARSALGGTRDPGQALAEAAAGWAARLPVLDSAAAVPRGAP